MNLDFISAYSIIIPFLVGLSRFKKLEKNFKLFAMFIAFGFIIEVIATFFFLNHISVCYVYNIYGLVEMLCCLFLLHLTINHTYISKFILIAYMLSLLSWIVTFFTIKTLSKDFQYANSIYDFFIAAFATISMVRIASSSMVPLLQNSYYLRSIGFLFYFSSAIVLSLFTDNYFSPKFIFSSIYDLHAITNIISNVIYGISIWQNSRIQKTF
jgi:hypothetical protein